MTALAGGVGAARFLRGLLRVVPPEQVTAIVNTGDDEQFHGLHVSPDLDTVTYTLAEAHDDDTGWGLAGETFRCMDALDRYGVDTWFRLGDTDLATHLYRTPRLAEGATLSEVTAEIARAWGLDLRMLPMSDAPAPTVVMTTAHGPLPMQEWFVRHRSEPEVSGVDLSAAESAPPAPGVIEAIDEADVVVICPSNPIISIAPVLAVPGVRRALAAARERVVAVSPIVGGRTVKGPADRLMAGLGVEVSATGVARLYADVAATLVLDETDRGLAPAVEAEGCRPLVADTIMRDPATAAALAGTCLGAVPA